MSDSPPLVDLSYILEILGNDSGYISEVMSIFLDTMKSGLPKLEQLAFETDDYDIIHKQAHFLISSAAIIKVRNNYDNLVKINSMCLSKTGIAEIRSLVKDIKINYEEALPELINIIESHN